MKDSVNQEHLWHAILGYISQEKIHNLDGMFDLSNINSLDACESCLKKKINNQVRRKRYVGFDS